MGSTVSECLHSPTITIAIQRYENMAAGAKVPVIELLALVGKFRLLNS